MVVYARFECIGLFWTAESFGIELIKLIGINKLLFTSFNFWIIYVTSLINLSDSFQVFWASTVACCFVISYQTVFPCSPQNRPCGWWKHLILQRVGRRQPNVYHKGLILWFKGKTWDKSLNETRGHTLTQTLVWTGIELRQEKGSVSPRDNKHVSRTPCSWRYTEVTDGVVKIVA